jgi:two-component system, NtrC family, response regulator AtoC
METDLIGISRNIARVRELIQRIADTGINTVVCGESGVGKELVVKLLYQKSDRRGKPFIKVNCAALPDTLLESEMFGYEAGAFTGAQRKMRGKFEQAKEGVLFLDEIGDMSYALQSKLLHTLQDGEFIPLGSEKTVKSNAWVIAATNHDLDEDLKAGKFREDLYYRISTIKISIDPLRQRPEDIPPLIEHFFKIYTRQFISHRPITLSKKTIDKLCAYQWPGNVRELQNVLRRIIVLGEGEENIDVMIPVIETDRKISYPPGINDLPPNLIGLLGLDQGTVDLSHLSLKKFQRQITDQIEREIITYVLEKTGWNRIKAARILKVSYKTLLFKIRNLNIEPSSEYLTRGFHSATPVNQK